MPFLKDLKTAGFTGKQAVAGIERSLRPVTTYGDVTSTDGVNGLTIGRAPDIVGAVCLGMAKIAAEGPNGAADFEDARYWVEWAKPGSNGDAMALKLQESAALFGHSWERVTNLAELAPDGMDDAAGPTGCHLLDVGDPVIVYLAEDENGAGRHFINVRPGPLLVRIDGDGGYDGGTYEATVMRRPTADVDGAGDLALADLGTAGPTVIAINPEEVGESTHVLDAGTHLMGRLHRINADGTAVIHVSAAGLGGDVFVVGLTQTGGADGTNSTEPTWTYTVTRNGETLGTGMSPLEGRTEGSFTAATRGLGYYDAGVFVLLEAYEKPGTTPCVT